MKKHYEELVFDKTPDGVVCRNITEGKFAVSNELYEEIEEMFDDGRLYPYEIIMVEFIRKRNCWIIDISEQDF